MSSLTWPPFTASPSTGHRPPVPGLLWGAYPQRADDEGAAGRRSDPRAAPSHKPQGPFELHRLHGMLGQRGLRVLEGLHRLARPLALQQASDPSRHLAPQVAGARAALARWQALSPADRISERHRLRAALAQHGWQGVWRDEALGCVAQAGAQALGRVPHDTQLLAAHVLLDDQFAEMATGEGKTYAAALAAAVAALAGVPVHVLTANDYLVQRDAEALRPMFEALGLRVGCVVAGLTAAARRAAYACDLTYATAREVAFDYLRDQLVHGPATDELRQRVARLQGEPAGEPPVLRGLCMAVLDEADGLLIDEAGLPLVLSEAQDDPAQRAACYQALALARQLRPGRHLDWAAGDAVTWRPAGRKRLDTAAAKLGGAWLNRRHRDDLVEAALLALHRLQRDRHYLVRDGQLALLDAHTGRVSEGRVWSRGLQTLVELKEGLRPSPVTSTVAQISFQRFFPRYLRLCGMSGTLLECRRELAAVYQRRVQAVPLRMPSRRQLAPPRLFADAAARTAAVVERAQALRARGQPLLIGVDSVQASEALSAQLQAAGLPHQVLNARHDADEAAIVAAAGQPGALTVATQMAGRGTDIVLGPGVAALGGLQVLCCLDSVQPRLLRQLIGRSARQGDPGSAEVWHQQQAPGLADSALGRVLMRWQHPASAGSRLSTFFLTVGLAWVARRDEQQRARRRQQTLEKDRAWHARLNF